jgi:hypothetical protein
MKQFLQVEVNGSVEMQKKLDMARERYQIATTKFSSVSHKTDMGHFTKVCVFQLQLLYYQHSRIAADSGHGTRCSGKPRWPSRSRNTT